MKFSKLNDQKVGRILLLASLFVREHKHSTIKETTVETKVSPGDYLELEYREDLFSLELYEITEKWYEGNENVVGIFFEEK